MNPKNILLVHNNPYALYLLKESLREEGYNVAAARDGEDGLRCLKRHRPDLISLDLNLPRRTGIMFYHATRRNTEWSRIPMVVVSGNPNGRPRDKDDWDIFAGRKVFGPSIYLEKPIRLEDYLELIHRALGAEPTNPLLPTEIEVIRDRAIEAVRKANPKLLGEIERLLMSRENSSEKAAISATRAGAIV